MDKAPVSRAFVFLAGFALVVVGFGLLLVTTGCVADYWALLPLLGTIAGGAMIFFADPSKAAFPVVFCGYFAAMIGVSLVFVFSNRWTVGDWWPLLVLAIGLAIMPAGLHRYRKPKASYFAPSLMFILLSAVFALFSFGLVPLTFKEAFNVFWPILVVLLGAMLIGLYVYNRFIFTPTKKGRS